MPRVNGAVNVAPLPSTPLSVIGATLVGSPGAAGKGIVSTANAAAAWQTVPLVQAATGTGGFAKQNGTPNILTWNTPADGNMHPFAIYIAEFITALETGGAVGLNFTFGGHATTIAVYAGGQGPGIVFAGTFLNLIADPNTTVTLQQTSALTAGGPTTVWAAILGQ